VANERLGSVHGEVIIDYDDKGIAHTRLNVKGLGDDIDDLDDKLGRSTQNQRRHSEELDNSLGRLRKSLKNNHGDMDRLSNGMSGMFMKMASTIGMSVMAMGGLAIGGQLIGGLIATVIALLGVLAIVPGAILAIGLAAVTIALAKKGFEEFKKELESLKPAMEDLQNAVGKALFKDLASRVKELANDYIPLLKTGFVGLAQQLNIVAKGVLDFFKSAQTKGDLVLVFDASRAVVENLGRAFTNLLPAFRDIGVVGAQVFASLTGGAGDSATKFSEMIARMRESGQLEEFMRGGIAALKDLGGIVKNLFSIFNQLFGSINAGGGGFLDTLRDLTQGVVDWMHSLEGARAVYELGQTLAEVGSVIKDIFMAALKELGPIIAELAPGIRDLATQFRDHIVPAIQVIGPLIRDMAKWFSQNADAIGPLLVAFGAFVVGLKLATTAMGIFNAVMMLNPWVALAAAIIALVVLVIVYWDEIVAYLTRVWLELKATALHVWNGIVNFFKDLWNGVSAFFVAVWQGIGANLTAVWTTIVNSVSTVWNTIVSFFSGIWTSITTGIITAWNAVYDFFVGIFTKIKDYIVALLTAYKELIIGAWTAIVEFLRPVIEPIVEIIRGVFEIIYTIIKTVLELIWVVIQFVWNKVTEFWHATFDPIVEWWNGFWEGIKTTITSVWESIVAWFNQEVELFVQFWHFVVDPIVEWWNGFWNGIKDTITSIWNSVTQWFKNEIDLFVQFWHFVIDPVIDWWNGFWQGIKDTLSSIWGAISSWFQDQINRFVEFWHGVIDPIIDWWNGIWNKISTTVSDGVKAVMDFVTSLPGKIKDALSDAANWLIETGKNVIIGFINGVKNMVGQAVQQVKDFGSSIVNAAKSALGVRSPSILFRAIGEFTMLGYEEGINSLKKKVVGTMGGIASSIVVAGQLPKANPTLGVMTSTLATANHSIANSTRTVNIGQVIQEIKGNLDPTNPVAWREGLKNMRDGIRTLENDYRGS
jgi:phage-related protein